MDQPIVVFVMRPDHDLHQGRLVELVVFGMIGRAALSAMKRTAILVNVARGGVVVEADLLWALQTGVIHGAAADVFETEPAPPDHPLLALPNMVVTPHIAAGAADNFANTINQMFRNIASVSRGEPIPPADVVVG